MPIYEYECEECAFHFELKRRFDEDAGSPYCPRCLGKARRLFSPSLILFKGSGFYVTDSQSNRNRPLEKGKTDKAEGGKKEEGKSDKVEGSKIEEGKANKVDGGKKEEGKGRRSESLSRDDNQRRQSGAPKLG